MKYLSIVVPTYNEEKNLLPLVQRIHQALIASGIIYEIIFVDDHSSDATKEVITSLSPHYPVSFNLKKGKKGKAYSIAEGAAYANYDMICMLDADLQYPPEAIPEMIAKLDKADVVVANRKQYNSSKIRKVITKSFRNIFGKLLFRLDHDIQSGMKVFKREVTDTIKFHPQTGWTFDLEFIHRATEAGFHVENHDITFAERKSGDSKVSFLKTSLEIGLNALLVKTKNLPPYHVAPNDTSSMNGAGVRFKRKKYITHTTLHHSQSAIATFLREQKIVLGLLFIIFIECLFINPLLTLQVLVGALSTIYFIDVIFNLYIIGKSLNFPQEISFEKKDFAAIDEQSLPVYSILCPLYKEAHVVPHFLESISKLDYPKDKLDVMLLLEEDDEETIDTVNGMDLPGYVRTLVVPHSMPKTKPKACNYGLAHAKGEYLVIYDAEDMPDPLQLKKAYLGFQKADKNTLCLQAKLNYYNPHQNLLTRFFTAEYSLWFDVTLTGLQSLNSTIPLGGTSNHFRTEDLRNLQGWDAFNVTEDADLGIRLFKRGYKTAMIDSVTLEEANSKWGNWLRQRSRWIKGYMQTYLVHTRELFGFKDVKKRHSLIFHLIIGGKIAFILINPLLWLATLSYFALYSVVGETIEALYPSIVFYMAATSLIFGNFLFLYYYMIGCIKRSQYNLIKFIYFVPFYWLMISLAGFIALHQLIFKPHYWEKTVHGLHLKKTVRSKDQDANIPEVAIPQPVAYVPALSFPGERRKFFYMLRLARMKRIVLNLIQAKSHYFSGSILISSLMIGNFLNFLFNAYLGRALNYETFGLVSLISSFLYLTAIPFQAVGQTTTYRSGFLEERYGKRAAFDFWSGLNKNLWNISLVVATLWMLSTPFLMNYFRIDNMFPILLFMPVWLIGFAAAANKGFINGKLMFTASAILVVIDPLVKLISSFGLISLGLEEWVYVAIPLSVVIGFFFSMLFISRLKTNKSSETNVRYNKAFPSKFFLVSLLSGLSAMTFLSLDVIFAKHYLSPTDAGQYALVSLVGKMIYFLSTLFVVFITPFVSRSEGANKNSSHILDKSFAVASILATTGFVLIGVFGDKTIPFLFGEKAQSISTYLLPFAFAVGCFSISTVLIQYYLSKKVYIFSFITFFLALAQVILITLFHENILQLVNVMLFIGYANLMIVVLMHIWINKVTAFENNVKDFLGIFAATKYAEGNKSRILIFNWRDTRHRWAGGAEVYIHELAKRWVQNGNSVTVFCGNDHHSPRNQTIDGVNIVRRGGFYTVYFWAFVYYILKFRGKYDIIIDSANGIPFLTPIYVKKPIFLLIHHVHQEVFREHLPFPLSTIAAYIEGKLMPTLYNDKTIITVSDSSRQEVIKLGFNEENEIHVVHPGIVNEFFFKTEKTTYPTFIYLGRLKAYKNIDVLVEAFSKVVAREPLSKLNIVGTGESFSSIKKLVTKLELDNNVQFFGKVTEVDKIKLLGQSWAAIQPSQVEGWGITVIEANAAGTPVIASNVNGLRDSIVDRQTGILVNLKNIDQFTGAMLTLIHDEQLRNQLSQEAYAWSQNFNWDKSAEDFLAIIIKTHGTNIEYKTAGKLALQKVEGI